MMELDTGASVSLISKTTWNKLFPQLSLQPSLIRLRTYTCTGELIKIVGQREMCVKYGEQEHSGG